MVSISRGAYSQTATGIAEIIESALITDVNLARNNINDLIFTHTKMKIGEVRIKLYVRDFDTRRSFYENKLEWQVVKSWDEPRGDRGVMFRVGALIFELLEAQAIEVTSSPCDLSLEVSDVRVLWNQFKDSMSIAFPLRKNSWGDTSFCINDPGGFQITFFSPDR